MENKIDKSEAIRLREAASRLGRTLVWHAENTPLVGWQAAADAGGGVKWPCGLFHALYNARTKREPTVQEVAEIARRLAAMRGSGTVPLAPLTQIAQDPDWALFSLPEADVI